MNQSDKLDLVKQLFIKRIGTAYLTDNSRQHFVSSVKDSMDIADLFMEIYNAPKEDLTKPVEDVIVE